MTPQQATQKLFTINWHKPILDDIAALIRAGANVNALDANGRPLLAKVVEGKSDQALDLLLVAGADVTLLTEEEKSKGTNGTRKRLDAITEFLNADWANVVSSDIAGWINRGVYLDSRHKDGGTALMYAAYRGNNEAVNTLIEYGANVLLKDTDGHTAKDIANSNGNTEIAGILDATADFLMIDWTKITSVRLNELITKGANIRAQNSYNDPIPFPLMKAIFYDADIKVLNTLINKGSDVCAVDMKRNTPLMYAAYKGNKKTLNALIAAGTDINMKNNDNYTARDIAQYNKNTEIVEILDATSALLNADWTKITSAQLNDLIAKGANIHARDNEGSTMLIKAAFSKNFEAVKVLIQNNADINAVNEDGLTALMCASFPRDKGALEKVLNKVNGSLSDEQNIVETLLANGADVTIQDKVGKIAMDYVGEDNFIKKMLSRAMATDNLLKTDWENISTEKIQKLIKEGANVNIQDEKGMTPIMHLVKAGRCEEMNLFIDAGADITLKDNDKQTALDIASIYGRAQAVNILVATESLLEKDLKTINVNDFKSYVNRGANINARDKSGRSIWMKTAFSKRKELMLIAGEKLGKNMTVKGIKTGAKEAEYLFFKGLNWVKNKIR